MVPQSVKVPTGLDVGRDDCNDNLRNGGVTILQRPMRLRTIMMAVFGVMLGSGFTPSILSRLQEWISTITAMTIFVGIVTVTGLWGLRRFMNLDTTTTYFSAVPGEINDMTIAGGETGGDEKTIALVHSLRILLTVLIIPLWFRLFEGIVTTDTFPTGSTPGNINFEDILLLTALWIAFAPGGLAEMAMISLVLGADPAFVATHHLYRVILLIIVAPVIFQLIKKRFDL